MDNNALMIVNGDSKYAYANTPHHDERILATVPWGRGVYLGVYSKVRRPVGGRTGQWIHDKARFGFLDTNCGLIFPLDFYSEGLDRMNSRKETQTDAGPPYELNKCLLV